MIIDGRLRSLGNGQKLESVATFSGDVRIEADVEKQGPTNHTAWDLAIGLRSTDSMALGVLRFDHEGIDAVGVGENNQAIADDPAPRSILADAPNLGHVTFTYVDSQATFSLKNADGTTITSATKSLPLDEPYRLYIDLAAHSDSPRYIDNIHAYSLAVPEPTAASIAMAGLLVLAARHRRRRGE